jgi:hypothetical protein
MAEWWTIHQNDNRLPIMDEDEKSHIQYLTGNIPLLLRPLLQYSGKEFKDIESMFLNSNELKNIVVGIHTFANRKRAELNGKDGRLWIT